MADSLTATLREATDRHHRAVERTRYMQSLLRGEVDTPGYARYLRSLHPVYVALEAALVESREHPASAALEDDTLARSAAIEADLAVLHGVKWQREIAAPPAALDYAELIRSRGRTAPHRLVAHCYLRYLGDLSGGQILRRVLARNLGLNERGGGLAFYDYPELEDLDGAKEAYRGRIDELRLTSAERTDVIEEAIAGYEAHGQVFAGLAS